MTNHEVQGECPFCYYRTDRSSEAHGLERRPRAGDLAVCLRCGKPCRFDERLNMRALSEDGWAALRPETRRKLEWLGAQIKLRTEPLPSEKGAGR